MKKIWIGIGVVVIVALAIVFFVTQTKKEPKVIKIGAILPLTGKMGAFGEWQQRALLLAEEKIKEEKILGEKKLRFIFEDSKAQPKEAVAAVNKLINIDKVKILFVFKSTLIEAVEPITDKAKVLLFAFAMDPELGKSPNTFRIYPNMKQQNQVMLDYLKQSNAKKIGILYVQTPATEFLVPKMLIPGIKELGKSVVVTESFEEEDKDIRTQVSKIKASNPDVVITLAHFVFIPNILTTFKEFGLLDRISVLGDLSYTFPVKVSPELLEGIYFVSPRYALKTIHPSNASWFEERCMEKFGEYPGYDPAFFFDAAMILAEGLKQYGTDIEKLSDYLLAVREYPGVTGSITIGKDRNAKVDMVIGVFHSGKRVLKED